MGAVPLNISADGAVRDEKSIKYGKQFYEWFNLRFVMPFWSVEPTLITERYAGLKSEFLLR
jgi:hypothetical protein